MCHCSGSWILLCPVVIGNDFLHVGKDRHKKCDVIVLRIREMTNLGDGCWE